MSVAVWAAVPWIVAPAVIFYRLSRTTHLKDEAAVAPDDAPLVSVICPARNEAVHIAEFTRAALASTYPRFELIIVDDSSTDGTAELARSAGASLGRTADGAAGAVDPRLTVITAPPLPAGWFGKQWACHTGMQRARGEILFFTDADTRHGPELVTRSVNAMRRRGSDMLSVVGQQTLGSFWERVVQPSVFTVIFTSFGGAEAVSNTTDPKKKIANGQCIFVRRDAYDAMGGHDAIKQFVVEDLMLAQRLCAIGRRVHLVTGMDQMTTRMYSSLGEIIAGWTKNIWAGGRCILPENEAVRGVLRVLMPLSALPSLVPFVALVLGLAGVLSPAWTTFGAISYAALTAWSAVGYTILQQPLWYAFLHPLGAAVATWIFTRAAWNGDRVRWKAREYTSA